MNTTIKTAAAGTIRWLLIAIVGLSWAVVVAWLLSGAATLLGLGESIIAGSMVNAFSGLAGLVGVGFMMEMTADVDAE